MGARGLHKLVNLSKLIRTDQLNLMMALGNSLNKAIKGSFSCLKGRTAAKVRLRVQNLPGPHYSDLSMILTVDSLPHKSPACLVSFAQP